MNRGRRPVTHGGSVVMKRPTCGGVLNSLHQRRHGARNGLAIVELAFLILLLMLILMGLIDFARVFYAAVTISDAARAGAQYGSQTNGHTQDKAGMTTAAEEDSVNLVDGITVTASSYCRCQGSPVRINCITETCPCITADCPERVPQLYVEVQAQHLFETLTQIPLLPKSVGLNQVTTIRVQ